MQDASDVLSEFGWDAPTSTSRPALSLPPGEAALIGTVAKLGTPLLDDLVLAAGKSAAELLPLLTMLELKGLIKSLPGGRYTHL